MLSLEPTVPFVVFAVLLGLAVVVLLACLWSRPVMAAPAVPVKTAYLVETDRVTLHVLADNGLCHSFILPLRTVARLNQEAADIVATSIRKAT